MNVEMCEDVISGVWVNNREQNIQLLILFSCDFGTFVFFVCQMVPLFSHFLFSLALITNISNDSISIFQSSSRFQSEFVTFSVLNHTQKKMECWNVEFQSCMRIFLSAFKMAYVFLFFPTKMIIWSYGRRIYTNNTRAFIAHIHMHTHLHQWNIKWMGIVAKYNVKTTANPYIHTTTVYIFTATTTNHIIFIWRDIDLAYKFMRWKHFDCAKSNGITFDRCELASVQRYPFHWFDS